jgi:cellulose synthase/poly-beta-1,6-N-acetylglucosamine synthase-like glycosyltransferase
MKEITIGIGIAAHNEEANIGKLLQNLLTQPLEDSVLLEEIIVVASGCTDRTKEIVEEFAMKDKRVKHIMEEERRGKSSAVNLILKNAQDKDVLVMLSADNLPKTGSLKNLIKPLMEVTNYELRKEKIGAVSSHPTPVNDRNTLFGFIAHLIWDLHYALSLNGNVKLTGEFYAIKPSLVKEIPRVVNDDLYIEYLIKKQGYKIKQALDAVSYMNGPETLKDFLTQRVRVHIGHYQIARMTEYVPQTVKATEILKKMIKVVDLRKMYFLVAAIVLEMCAKGLALFLFHRNKIPYKWDYAESTKNIGGK